MKTYKLIGLTGTTGSGKGQACKVFKKAGYRCIDADVLAHEALEMPVVADTLALNFGSDLMLNEKIDRELLASRAFKDSKSTALLNSITHPYITSMFIEQVKKLSKESSEIVFDAPQLFESNLDILCDCTVAVIADEDVRIQRIMKRDNITLETARRRINAQYSDEFFKQHCDYIIENNADINSLEESVYSVLKKL